MRLMKIKWKSYSSTRESPAGKRVNQRRTFINLFDLTEKLIFVLYPGQNTFCSAVTALKCGSKGQRFKPGATVRVPKDQRTPLVVHLLAALSKQRIQARTYKSKYFKKCAEVKGLKKHDEESALSFLSGKVNPRFYKLLRAEVRNYSRKPQARKWFPEELAEYETMRQRGPKCFKGLPFTKPSRKPLTSLTKKLNPQPGINPLIMELLKSKIQAMPKEERLCSIIFDEASIK